MATTSDKACVDCAFRPIFPNTDKLVRLLAPLTSAHLYPKEMTQSSTLQRVTFHTTSLQPLLHMSPELVTRAVPGSARDAFISECMNYMIVNPDYIWGVTRLA